MFSLRVPRARCVLVAYLFCLLPNTFAIAAERSVEPVLSAGFGIRVDAVREDLLVPLTFSGPGGRILLGYESLWGSGEFSAHGDLGMAFLFNRYGHFAATFDHGIHTAWLLPLWRNHAAHLSMGPSVVLESRMNYLASWDDAHGYWLGAEWLGPKLRYARSFRARWHWESSASFALVALQGRPPTYRYNKQDALTHLSFYFTRPWQEQQVVTLTDFQAIRLDLKFRRALYRPLEIANGWALGLDARLSRTTLSATNINLSACFYVARGWRL